MKEVGGVEAGWWAALLVLTSRDHCNLCCGAEINIIQITSRYVDCRQKNDKLLLYTVEVGLLTT